MAPKLKSLTLILYTFAIFWLIFAVYWFYRNSPYSTLYSSIGFLYSCVLFVLTYFIGKKAYWAWRTTLIVMSAGILTSAIDDIGIADILYIACSLCVYFVLLKGKPLMRIENEAVL